jgi:poly(3-hydroxybutyrate) depolymerase
MDASVPGDAPLATKTRDGGLASQIATGGLPGPREACYGLPGENRLTPGTMIRYCQGAHADCKQPGARCPLYVTVQGSGAYFGRLKDAARYGKFITVELRSTGDDDAGTLEAIAQVPRLVARDFPGLDEDRVYVVGQSGGSYFVRRALCLGPAADRALAGSISDVYAAWASLIMCPKCDRPFVPKAGNFHVLNIIGEVDGTTAGQCGAELRMMAQGLGCATPHGGTCNVPAGDPLHPRADGGPAARKMLFGACSKGSLAAYVMNGEAHTVKFAKAYSPAVDAYEIAWQWFQDKRKSGGGAAVGTACPM